MIVTHPWPSDVHPKCSCVDGIRKFPSQLWVLAQTLRSVASSRPSPNLHTVSPAMAVRYEALVLRQLKRRAAHCPRAEVALGSIHIRYNLQTHLQNVTFAKASSRSLYTIDFLASFLGLKWSVTLDWSVLTPLSRPASLRCFVSLGNIELKLFSSHHVR